MSVVLASLGSNVGDRLGHLRNGIRGSRSYGLVPTAVSAVYETEPVDCRDPDWFLNCAARFETELSPRGVLEAFRALEAAELRGRPYANAPRTLDMDIIFYDRLIMAEDGLAIPHPRAGGRRFVLVPLLEVAPPGFVHPVTGATLEDMVQNCPDRSRVVVVALSLSFPYNCARKPDLAPGVPAEGINIAHEFQVPDR